MEHREFIDKCRQIVLEKGKFDEYEGMRAACACYIKHKDVPDSIFYGDDVIEIIAVQNTQEITITRKENGNPVACVRPYGTIIRWNGEARHLFEHVRNLGVS